MEIPCVVRNFAVILQINHIKETFLYLLIAKELKLLDLFNAQESLNILDDLMYNSYS